MILEFEVTDSEEDKNTMGARLLEVPDGLTPAHLVSVAMTCAAFTAMSNKGMTVQDVLMDMLEMAPANTMHTVDEVS